MRSRTGNSLSTLMFLIPLFGVPLMAIFGVPQFVPVIASSVSDDAARSSGTGFKPGVGESASATTVAADQLSRDSDSRGEQPIQDLFSSTSRPRRDSRPLHSNASRGLESKFVETSLSAETWATQRTSEEPNSETTQKLNDLFGTSLASDKPTEPLKNTRPSATRSTAEPTAPRSKATRFAASTDKSDDGLTWRDAVSRLNELGIQEFRLEPGSRLGEFYFACQFTPHRDARVTRRFEAEATEPLLAVKAVLLQIDEWLTRH